MFNARSAFLLAVGLILGVAPTTSHAQLAPSFNVQQFVPVSSYHEFVTVETARMAPALTPTFNLVFDYSHRNLERQSLSGERRYGIIDGVVGGNFRFDFSITNWLDVGVNLPFMQLTMVGEGLATENQGVHYGLGDLGLKFKIAPLNADTMPVGVAIIPFVNFPTGMPRLYASDGTITFGGKVAVSKRWERFHFGAHVGYMVKPGNAVVDDSFSAGDEIPYGVAVGVSPLPDLLDINLELMGAGMVGSGRGDVREFASKALVHAPLELLVNARLRTPIGLDVVLGGGPGLTAGAGTPDFRVFLGAAFSPEPGARDPDKDGIKGDDDQCPDDPEDMDGFEDTDGCPDEDNDGDGVLDVDDRCPDDPEDKDGFEDTDGCPDPDNDGDGILDGDDECPMDPEDIDEFEDEDGCPDDNDGDGIADADDECPMEPEDKDGFEDTDGCPDPDNDGDGILDDADYCPDQPENVNGVKDEDGCPDEVKAVIKGTKILILDKVFFVTAKDVIVSKSFPVLDAVTQTLVDNPQIKKVRVEGHTDSRGNDEYNLNLSDKRAAAVVRYLTEHGVDAERLESEGFGETRPIDSNDTSEGRQNNRRVEFTILEQATVLIEVPVDENGEPIQPAEEGAEAEDAEGADEAEGGEGAE